MGRSIRISPEYFPEHYLVIQRYHLSRPTFCSWLVCWSHCLIVPQPLTVSYCLASCCHESRQQPPYQPPDLVFTLMTNPVSLSNAQCRSEPHPPPALSSQPPRTWPRPPAAPAQACPADHRDVGGGRSPYPQPPCTGLSALTFLHFNSS